MYNLQRFILKHHFVILFILLEVISILLLARSQNFHRSSLVNTSNAMVGKIYEWSSEIGNYFRLNSANKQLAEENAMLRQQLSVVYDTTSCIFDTNEGDTLYKYIPAQVVNNSTNQANNYIIINKGTLDGIQREMSVMSTDGIVGVVTDVSRHYASVMSLLHSKSVVGVRFRPAKGRYRCDQLPLLHFPRRLDGRHSGRVLPYRRRRTEQGQNPVCHRLLHPETCLCHSRFA